MELFSEVYGCYFTVLSIILKRSNTGITIDEMDKILRENAFCDTSFHLLPKLFSNEWDFLEKKDDKFYSKSDFSYFKRPLTLLEKSWIKTLLKDNRILLFISEEEVLKLEDHLKNIEPLFYSEDFHIFDSASDGDDYEDEDYIKNFKKILSACKANVPLLIEYESPSGNLIREHFVPWKICYSQKDDKFRLLCETKKRKFTLNLSRIKDVAFSEESDLVLSHLHIKSFCIDPIIIEISNERNALERCMLQFASWEKQTEYDDETKKYICKIYYDKQDETELLIRILAFGPVIKVLGPRGFLKSIKERIFRQIELIS